VRGTALVSSAKAQGGSEASAKLSRLFPFCKLVENFRRVGFSTGSGKQISANQKIHSRSTRDWNSFFPTFCVLSRGHGEGRELRFK
jgi:hypothetical protein